MHKRRRHLLLSSPNIMSLRLVKRETTPIVAIETKQETPLRICRRETDTEYTQYR